MKLTKQLLKRFEDAEIEVRLINGHYNRATATVKYANGWIYVVEVTRTHPLTEMFGGKESRKFLWPTSAYTHNVLDVPEELQLVADKLYKLAEIKDEEAAKRRKALLKLLSNHYEEPGLN